MLRGLRSCLPLFFAWALLPACVSEAGPEPEPTVDIPGAFTAVDEGDGFLALYRTLDTLRVEGDVLVMLTHYDVQPRTWEEARETAMQDDLPMLFEATAASLKLFPSGPSRVVWYRSLTDEERDRVP